jgi:uncharacterized protein DUF4440
MRSITSAAALCLGLAICAPAVAGPTAGPEPTQRLYDEIAAMDTALFAAAFDRCDIKALGEMVTDDIEFIHDKWGMTSNTKAAFVGNVEKTCARQATGEDYRARRELVPGSMSVHPINNYGAMQMGEHRFYRLAPGKPEELVEAGRFIDIWKQVGGKWKLFRVISYDHRLTK